MECLLAGNDELSYESEVAMAEDGKYFLRLNTIILDQQLSSLLRKSNFQNLVKQSKLMISGGNSYAD